MGIDGVRDWTAYFDRAALSGHRAETYCRSMMGRICVQVVFGQKFIGRYWAAKLVTGRTTGYRSMLE